jgi:DNA invertase Pin-like site-specific DNA recombinase
MDYIYARDKEGGLSADEQIDLLFPYFPAALRILEVPGKWVQLSVIVNQCRTGDRIIIAGLDILARPDDLLFLLTVRRIAVVSVCPSRINADTNALQITAAPLKISAGMEQVPSVATFAGKLSEAQWDLVDKMASEGISQVDIARQFGVSTASISRFLAGKQHMRQKKSKIG